MPNHPPIPKAPFQETALCLTTAMDISARATCLGYVLLTHVLPINKSFQPAPQQDYLAQNCIQICSQDGACFRNCLLLYYFGVVSSGTAEEQPTTTDSGISPLVAGGVFPPLSSFGKVPHDGPNSETWIFPPPETKRLGSDGLKLAPIKVAIMLYATYLFMLAQ